MCDCTLLEIQTRSFKSEISTTVYLQTCILVCLAVEAGGARQSLGGAAEGQGQGLGERQKAAAAAPSPLLGSHLLLPKLHHRPKDQTKQGSPWVRLGQTGSGARSEYTKEVAARTCD